MNNPTINMIEDVAESIGEVSISGSGAEWEVSIETTDGLVTDTGGTIREALICALEEIAVSWETYSAFAVAETILQNYEVHERA